LVDGRKQAELQLLQAPSKGNEDNLSNLRQEARRLFTNKKKEYLKDRFNEFESNSNSKNIRDLYSSIKSI
jgi:hypothetical protein